MEFFGIHLAGWVVISAAIGVAVFMGSQVYKDYNKEQNK